MKNLFRSFKKFSVFLCLGCFLLILIFAYLGTLSNHINRIIPGFMSIPFIDIVAHFILYGIVAYSGHLFLQRKRLNLFGLIVPFWPFLFGIFTIVEEGLQSFSPLRTFSFLDGLFSLLGILVGYWLAEKVEGKHKNN